MDLLHKAITMNNTAALIAKGDADNKAACLAAFQQAIHMVRLGREQGGVAVDPSHAHRTWNEAFVHDDGMIFVGRECSGVYTDLVCDSGYIYNHPLCLSSNPEIANHGNAEGMISVVSAAIIFNLALSWHDLGINTSSKKALTKAGTLYSLVGSLLHKSSSMGHGHNKWCKVLKCLVLNNQAVLYHQMGMYPHCDQCRIEACKVLTLQDCLEEYLSPAASVSVKFNLVHLHAPHAAGAA